MKTRYWALALAPLALLAAGAATTDDWRREHRGPLVQLVRDATRYYHDPDYAMQMGYMPMACVSGPNGGAMGVHFINGAFFDAVLNVSEPEALIYEPLPGGKLRLVGVEYITPAGPAELEGHLLNLVNGPNRYGPDPFYELHVWAWKDNPNGTFADWNPRVSCEYHEPTAG